MAQANSAIINSTLPISTKYTKIVGKWIKKRSVDQAINLLERVIIKEVKKKIDNPRYILGESLNGRFLFQKDKNEGQKILLLLVS
jgi:ribosomal protein L22